MSVTEGRNVDAVYRCIAANVELGGIGIREICEATGLRYHQVQSSLDVMRRRGDALVTRRDGKLASRYLLRGVRGGVR